MKSQIHAYECIFGRNVEARRFVNFLIGGGLQRATYPKTICGGDSDSSSSSQYVSIEDDDEDFFNESFDFIKRLNNDYIEHREFDTIRELAKELETGLGGKWKEWILWEQANPRQYHHPRLYFTTHEIDFIWPITKYLDEHDITGHSAYEIMDEIERGCESIFYFVQKVATPQQPNKYAYHPSQPVKPSLDAIQFAKRQIDENPFQKKYTPTQMEYVAHLERETLKSRAFLTLHKKGADNLGVTSTIFKHLLPAKNKPPNVVTTMKDTMIQHLKQYNSYYQQRNIHVPSPKEYIADIRNTFVDQFGPDALHYLEEALKLVQQQHRLKKYVTIHDIRRMVKNAILRYNMHRDLIVLKPALEEYLLDQKAAVLNSRIVHSLTPDARECLARQKHKFWEKPQSQELLNKTLDAMYNDCIKALYPQVYT